MFHLILFHQPSFFGVRKAKAALLPPTKLMHGPVAPLIMTAALVAGGGATSQMLLLTLSADSTPSYSSSPAAWPSF